MTLHCNLSNDAFGQETRIKLTRKATFHEFDHLERALIDASSIIYADRAGFLDLLTTAITIYSIEEIFIETGPVTERIKPLTCKGSHPSVDQKLIACSQERDLPVISDDKKILLAIKDANRPFFNSLMMLNFLLYRRHIDMQEYDRYLQALKEFSRYGTEVWHYGAKIRTAIKQLI